MNARCLRNEDGSWSRSECWGTPSGLYRTALNYMGTAFSLGERRISYTKTYNSSWAFLKYWVSKAGLTSEKEVASLREADTCALQW